MNQTVSFIAHKAGRFLIAASAWLTVLIAPVVAARFRLFEGLYIAGRCRAPLLTCGQDNVALAYMESAIIPIVLAVTVTWLCVQWNDPDWIKERNKHEFDKRNSTTEEPTQECVCGHLKRDHWFLSDHDECNACFAEGRSNPCSSFDPTTQATGQEAIKKCARVRSA